MTIWPDAIAPPASAWCPFCMFTDPERARVGLNERSEEAWRVLSRGENPMAAVLRTWTVSEPRGFIKMLIGETSHQTLGLSAFCAEVSDLMAAVQTAMLGHLLVLRDALTYPTATEGLTVLLADADSRDPVRTPPRTVSQEV